MICYLFALRVFNAYATLFVAFVYVRLLFNDKLASQAIVYRARNLYYIEYVCHKKHVKPRINACAMSYKIKNLKSSKQIYLQQPKWEKCMYLVALGFVMHTSRFNHTNSVNFYAATYKFVVHMHNMFINLNDT